jgi:hypothetical protein
MLMFICMISFSVAQDVRFATFGHVYVDYDALDSTIDRLNSYDLDFVVFLGDTLSSPADSYSSQRIDAFVNRLTMPVYFGLDTFTQERT